MVLFRPVVATLLLSTLSVPVFAADVTNNGVVKPAADVSLLPLYRGAAQQSAAKAAIRATKLNTGATANELFANPDRSYPPSCLSAPMPFGMAANDPNRVQSSILLPGDPLSTDATENTFTEMDSITVFRVPCSGGVSATLIEIDRPANADPNHYPILPGISISSAQTSSFIPRLADDPNTFLVTLYAYDPLPNSDVFVLENYINSSVLVDFNPAISVFVNNLIQGSGADTQRFDLAAYNPAQYAATSQPLPISGYETGTWYDSAHSGEGIQTEVGEVGTAGTQRFLSVSWYTYDPTGTPYWLIGSGVINIGDNTANVTVAYATGGGFAGNFGSKATQALWGTMKVTFPDCNTMQFTYDSTTGIPSTVPTGTGTRTWKRFTTVNGLTCQ